MLQNSDQAEVFDHDGKANILWHAFKESMGKSDNPTMEFNLEKIISSSVTEEMNSTLQAPFTDKEIEEVVKHLPNEKSPGPDGFNNEFVKGCWTIIAPDIKKLINDFHDGTVSLESINSSYITLIPKSDNPSTSSDFTPISLLNCVLKIITKLLANRLQDIILSLVHKN
jgi:hypothetical protein